MLRRILILAGLLCPATLYGATVTIGSGRTLQVDGQPFSIKGVNYSPAPVGYSVAGQSAGCIGPYSWWLDRATYMADFPQVRALGANTIRTFDLMNSTATAVQVRQALDAAQANGLKVIMGYFVQTTPDLSQAPVRALLQAQFVAAVNAFKDHPAVLMWAFGNEVNLNNGNTNPNWYSLIQQVATAAKTVDPNHPIMTVEGECLGPDCGLPAGFDHTFLKNIGNSAINADDASLTDLDIWGINVYRGTSFDGVIQALNISTMTAKPILIAEFGKDAYRDGTAAEDADMQAGYISAQWQEINSNLSVSGVGAASLIGGVVFEWGDEWWKDSGNDCETHGTQVLFHRTNDAVDPNYQDEYFGINAVTPINSATNSQGTSRVQRKAFSTLQAFWNPSAVTAAQAAPRHFFADTVRNFPNPFRSGDEPTRFVAYVNDAGTLDVQIYDASGQFVTSLPPVRTTGPGRYEVVWEGRNRQGEYVSPGLYYARIEGHGVQHQDKQFRKVVAVK